MDDHMRGNHYGYLLGALLLLLFASSVTQEHFTENGRTLLQIAFVASLCLGVWTLGRRWWLRVGLVLAAASVVSSSLAVGTASMALHLTTAVVYLLFLMLTIVIATRDVFSGTLVTFNKILGAACIYLLLGLIWAIAGLLLHVASPGAYAGLGDAPAERKFPEFVYHSFVTLTTLGYGDVVPKGAVARFLAYAEALMGQFYLTVLVAALVGMHIVTRQKEEARPGA